MKRSTVANNQLIKEKGTLVKYMLQLLQDTAWTCYERKVPVFSYQGEEYICDWVEPPGEQEINLFK